MDKYVIEGLKDKLPVVPGLNGKEEYFNFAVLVLLMYVNEEYHFIFEKRAANIRQPGEICFPGGKFEPAIDTSLRDTAIRETVEELGVSSEKIQIIGNLDTVVSTMGATADAFLGILELRNLDDLQINLQEVEKVFMVPVSYFEANEPEVYQVNMIAHPSYFNQAGEEVTIFPARELGLPDRYTKPWGNVLSNVFVYRVEEVIIWGMTARLIKDVVAKLKSL
ncbi:CoA pyrophosphatase [Desulfosporosinus fructosivorans]|uniref:CoA pyrophosphatase n=1 Tax=Desulfosporosinus fructosivorans TaxID=2018669 RepID=A0A4Z0R8R6_9FIRM|nr:CoA pyrophosphatase [Desulfosporosinus fructosivorans]TGE38427.1 CoA pyrophosphatase [Desulfosporosinus fructosivorans]